MAVRATEFVNDYKDANGKVDLARLRNILVRIPEADISPALKANLMEKTRATLKRTVEAELASYIRLSEPYSSNSQLPPGVKNALPDAAQTIYRKAFNAALVQYGGNEGTAAKVAWSAVKRMYKKVGDTWVLKESGADIFARISEAVVPEVQKLLWLASLRVASARQKLSAAPEAAAPEEKPVAESMMESYPLSAEVLSEVAAFEQGTERVLRGCTFISAGVNVPKTRRWPAELLESHLECFQDSLCFIDHPADGAPRSLRALAGHTRNPRFDKATNSVVGDIVLLDNEAANYVVSLFSNETVRKSEAVGLSVLWEGGTFEADFEQAGDKTIQVPRELRGKCEVDFVARPSAGGRVHHPVTV